MTLTRERRNARRVECRAVIDGARDSDDAKWMPVADAKFEFALLDDLEAAERERDEARGEVVLAHESQRKQVARAIAAERQVAALRVALDECISKWPGEQNVANEGMRARVAMVLADTQAAAQAHDREIARRTLERWLGKEPRVPGVPVQDLIESFLDQVHPPQRGAEK